MFKRSLVLLLGLALTAPVMAAGWGGHYRGGYGGHYHGYHGGDAGGALVAGLVFGGLLGYLISEDQHYQGDVYWNEPGRTYYYPAYEYPRYVRVVPVPVPSRVVVQDPEFAGENCQMTREYTTTIEIDGKKHDAYGTRCLTPDGQWILGRPKLVPNFN